MPKNEFRYHHALRIRWSDCDAQGIAFNGAYMDFLEVALAEYFRNLGIRLYGQENRDYFDTATVKATLEYKAPVQIDDLVDVYLRVSRIGTKSITTNAEIYRDGENGLLFLAEVVYVDYDSRAGRGRAVPDDIRELVGHFEQTGEVLPIDMFPNLARLIR